MQDSGRTYDIDKICRCCLKKAGVKNPLHGCSLDDMLRSVANLQVERDDGHPQFVCYRCVLQLSQAFRFRERCRNSNAIICEYIKTYASSLNKTSNSTGKSMDADVDGDYQDDSYIAHDDGDFETNPEKKEQCPQTVEDGEPSRSLFISAVSRTSSQNSTIPRAQCQSIPNLLLKDTKDNEISYSSEKSVDAVVYGDHQDDSSIAHDGGDFETNPEKKEQCSPTVEDAEPENVTNNETEFTCDHCNKAFKRKKQLLRHHKIHNKDKPFKCTTCNKTFSEKCNLNKHIYTHTGELRNAKNRPHLCSTCGKSFKFSSSLFKHMKFHTGKNLFRCQHCLKYYAEKCALKIHMRCHTGERPHVCDQCGRQFTQQCNLQKHLRYHSGERPFKCPICERTFVERTYIAVHMETHNSEKKALCSVCGKTFASAKSLGSHFRIFHNENRQNITCGFANCSKTFTRKDSAIIHRRIHSREKPYSCETCHRSFTTSTQLTIHSRTHTGEKYFVCKQCPMKFASKSGLMSHCRKHKHSQSETDLNQEPITQSGRKEIVLDQKSPELNQPITKEMLRDSVLLFKLDENGQLVLDGGSSIANVSIK